MALNNGKHKFYTELNGWRKGKVEQDSIQLFIVDDMPQVRLGLASMLELATKNTRPKIKVIGSAKNGEDAIRQVEALHPDVILMDLEMPVLDGFLATQTIKSRNPSIFILILTIHDDPATRQKAARLGANGFIAKSAPPDNLIRAILEMVG
jgi:DNA-binding NarL/FixJ family response regulator